MHQDTLDIEILADGTVKVTADQISGANHVSADELLAELERRLGGAVSRERRPEMPPLVTHAHGRRVQFS
jgi:hypothetical protein